MDNLQINSIHVEVILYSINQLSMIHIPEKFKNTIIKRNAISIVVRPDIIPQYRGKSVISGM